MVNIEKVLSVKLEDVVSVYSGKNGSCCCGCSGKHSYAAAHRDFTSKNRGYAVTDDDINDKQVRRVFGLMIANAEIADNFSDDAFGRHVSFVIGQRLYVVYLAPVAAEAVA